MIVQMDFITNSSSTSYVLLVPNNFSVTSEEVIKIVEDDFGEGFYDDEEVTKEELLEDTRNCIEKLKNGEHFYQYDMQHYFIISTLFGEKGLVITSFESGPDNGYFIPVAEKVIKEKLKLLKKGKK